MDKSTQWVYYESKETLFLQKKRWERIFWNLFTCCWKRRNFSLIRNSTDMIFVRFFATEYFPEKKLSLKSTDAPLILLFPSFGCSMQESCCKRAFATKMYGNTADSNQKGLWSKLFTVLLYEKKILNLIVKRQKKLTNK